MSDNPNPQGKGQVPVLAALTENRHATAAVPPKHIEQVSVELFTSLFVLESDFNFKPVPGNTYWLYQKEGRFWLSPVPPQEWSPTVYGRYIGECRLQTDMSWTLMLADEVAEDQAFLAYLEDRRARFEETLESAETLDDALPVHESRLPFYQRAFAYALAHSLGTSMERSGIRALSYNEARGLLAHQPDPGDA
ncbi:DUF2452 domain-containing protein [Aquisalimonas asiatica]|uniref:DUF2452 domain-containing protein n=1 Tax=Aquisalimonas asiatica TaxID=406100 RepID=A0A1H8TJA1_9GAMM|nr:DUF2452 domain-containing protein [Aquisalimonas asiatica]SEO90876.1 Protein of unknown function [Aquisalimonas asiatica]